MKLKKQMRVFILMSVILTLMVTTFVGCSDNKTSTKGTLTVATNAEFPPFEYINDDGEVDGFDIALIKEICNNLGYDVEVQDTEFDSLVGGIETGNYDLVIAAMTVNDERKKSVNFSDSYYTATQCIILRKDYEGITSIKDLSGKRVAVQEGTSGDFIASGEYGTVTDAIIKRFKRMSDAVTELKNKAVDAVLIDANPAKVFIDANSDILYGIEDTLDEPEEYAIAISKNNEELLSEINKELANLKENGTYDKIVDEYINNSNISKTAEDKSFIGNFKFIFIEGNRYMRLVDGFKTTVIIAVSAALIGILLGFILAVMKLTEVRYDKKTIFSIIANIYIDIIRGTPAVVQLLIMYQIVFRSKYGVLAAIFTFGINSSAYVAEIIRAGIMAVDKGQMEAGRSLGLSYMETMRYIIVPQAIKNILPALGNEFITLFKETSIAGYAAVVDLTKATSYIISRTYQAFLPLIVLAVIYFIIIKFLTKLLAMFENRLRKSDLR